MTTAIPASDHQSIQHARPQSAPLHVAVVDEELPYPLTSGKRIRTFNLISRLADRHHITWICHRNPNQQEEEQAREVMENLGIKVQVVDRAVPTKAGPRFYFRLGMNLFSSLPYSVATHNSKELQHAIHHHAQTEAVDLWHCEWTPYAESLRDLTNAPRLVIAHNVESMIWQRYMETESNPLKKWYIQRQWKKFAAFESKVVRSVDCTVAVSQADADFFAQQMSASQVTVVDNGVSTEFFRPTEAQREEETILFLGSLDWRPNLDAAQQLLDQIFPLVRQKQPNAKLWLVGRNPPPWLQEKANQPGVTLFANVPDVRDYLHRCSVMAVPLRIGGGSRLKILEALATECPVVSTPIGAEGLHLSHEEHLLLAEKPSGLADALIDAIRSPEQARQMASRGRERMLERYDWEALAQKLEAVWLQCASKSQSQ